jgi:hypothetical protein
MAANTNPIFTLTPHCSGIKVAEANTASDGSGTLHSLFTAQTNGSRVERIIAINAQASAAASSANVIRVFITDADGVNPILRAEGALESATRSTTEVGAKTEFEFEGGLVLAAGQIIKVCQSVYAGVQDVIAYTAEGGDY